MKVVTSSEKSKVETNRHPAMEVVKSTEKYKVCYCLLLVLTIFAFGYVLLSFLIHDQLKTLIIIRNVTDYVDLMPKTAFVMVNPSLQPRTHKRNFFSAVLTCKQKNQKINILCNLQMLAYCQDSAPADVMRGLWVVAPIYSYDQQNLLLMYNLHRNFKNYIESFGLSFCTIEGIREDLNQTYLVSHPNKEPYEIQIKIYDEVYMRENLLNVALRKIKNWEYVAWIDAHQSFENTYWWEEAIIKTEKFASVQLFRNTVRCNIYNETLERKNGIMYFSKIQINLDITLKRNEYPEYGNGYILRKELYDKMGYILDTCIMGGCDLSYVLASIPPNYIFRLLMSRLPRIIYQFRPWLVKTRDLFQGSTTYVRGDLIHFEHEHYFDYGWAALYERAGFKITQDLTRDANFTLRITNPKIRNIMAGQTYTYHFGN